SILCTTLTKKMAEDLSEFLKDEGIKAEYLHSDIKTIDRIRILTKLRKGEIRVLVGVNLLREGLDLPEVTLVAVLDADKEGFLRSDTALIQTIGRAARNVCGRVILYADRITNSMGRAIEETNRRREKQVAYNEKNGITPETIKKHIHDIAEDFADDREKAIVEELNLDMELFDGNKRKIITLKKKKMKEAVVELDFETAALLRDQIILLESTIKKRKSKTKKK
ncbi:MAG: excinuclease ABC subunit B, partial [Flavobacteriaceae bacterium]